MSIEPAALAFDVAALRAQFPSLASGVAHFDAPGGTQTPLPVARAIAAALTSPLSNRGTLTASERHAEDLVAEFRSAYADLLGVDPRGVVHGRSATALTYDLSRALAKTWAPGDEIVVTRLDHDANVRPWVQAAAAVGAQVCWVDLDPATAELDEESLAAAVTARTRLVAVTGASNLLGTKPDLPRIAALAHGVGAHLHVDAVHLAAHDLLDLDSLGADTLVCSPYKFLGPHLGVLGGRVEALEALRPDKLTPSTNEIPERFEFGTLPYELLGGATAAVDFLAALAPGDGTNRRDDLAASYAAIEAHELRLRQRLEAGLSDLGSRVVVHSRARSRTSTLLLTFPGRRSLDLARFLAARDVHAPAGSFYAYEPFRRLGLDDDTAMRLGLAPYSDDTDVDRVLDGLAAALDAPTG